ncbi:MAG: hypothetical protein ACYDHZ_00985 [Dehalococcoidia bacterium]
MSVLAYRVIEIKRAEAPSFKLGENTELLDYISADNDDLADPYDQLNNEGVGMVSVSVRVLKKAVKAAENLKLSPEVVAALKADIAWAEAQDVPDIQYDCY